MSGETTRRFARRSSSGNCPTARASTPRKTLARPCARHVRATRTPSLRWRCRDGKRSSTDRSALQTELRSRATGRSSVSLLAAFLFSYLLSQALSRTLARPLEAVSEAADRLARGEREARVRNAEVVGTREVAQLSAAFDRMADQAQEPVRSAGARARRAGAISLGGES